MREPRTGLTDATVAFFIGALVGVGVTLLLRPDEDDELTGALERVGLHGYRARRASKRYVRELRAVLRQAKQLDAGS